MHMYIHVSYMGTHPAHQARASPTVYTHTRPKLSQLEQAETAYYKACQNSGLEVKGSNTGAVLGTFVCEHMYE